MLRDLATLPGCTVWFLRRCENGMIGFAQFGSGQCEEQISVEEYRRRFCCWWANEDYRLALLPKPLNACTDAELDDEIVRADARRETAWRLGVRS